MGYPVMIWFDMGIQEKCAYGRVCVCVCVCVGGWGGGHILVCVVLVHTCAHA